MTPPEELLRIAEETIARARKEGATEAEAYVGSLSGLILDKLGRLVYAREVQETGIGLRVTMGKRVASAVVSGAAERAMPKVVAEALRRARAKSESSALPVYAEPAPMGAPTRLDTRLVALDEEALSSDVSDISTLLADAPDVTFHSTNLWTYVQRFAIANTRGVAAWDADALQIVQTEARVTRHGVSRTARETVSLGRPVRDAVDVEDMARRTVARAALATDARPLPRPVDEVIFTPYPAGQMLNAWLPALAGAADAPHAHPRASPVGADVASPHLTLTDAPRAATGPRRQRMDDEGTPASDLTLVENGSLRTRLFNATTAAQAGIAPTGHAFRGLIGRWGSRASVKPGNLHVEPGAKSLDDLIAGMDRGVVLTDQLMGAFIANTATGDFSLVAPTSLYVEKGSVVHALPSVTIGGDVHDVLRKVIAVGSDARSIMHGHIPSIHAAGVACAT